MSNLKTLKPGDTIRCLSPVLTLHKAADPRSECVSEILYGECAEILAISHGCLHLRLLADSYQGFMADTDSQWSPCTAEPVASVNAPLQVAARSTLLFEQPNLKSPVLMRLPFGARLLPDTDQNGVIATPPPEARQRPNINGGGNTDSLVSAASTREFLTLTSGAHVWRDHCITLPHTNRWHEGDAVALAESLFAGAPYRWGGRTPEGVDCSGLVQALAAVLGVELPRDSGAQEKALQPNRVHFADRQRGDLIYWPGHVAILLDTDTVFHATAWTMDTRREALSAVVARAGEATSLCRL